MTAPPARGSARPAPAGERSGELASVLGAGLEAIEAWLPSYRPARCSPAIVPVLVLVVVALIDPPTALVLVVTGPVLVLLLGVHRQPDRADQRHAGSPSCAG